MKLSRARGRRAGALLLGRRVAVVLNIQINAAFPAIIRGAQGGSYLSGPGCAQVKPNERGPPQRRSIKVALMRSVHFAAGRAEQTEERRMTNESHLGHLRRKLRAEAEQLSRIFQAKQYPTPDRRTALLEPMRTRTAMQVPLRQKALSDRRTCRNFHSVSSCGITRSFLSVFAEHERERRVKGGHHTKSSFFSRMATNKALHHLSSATLHPSIPPSEAFVLTANKARERRVSE